MANSITAEAVTWIRQQRRQLAPCRMAEILGVSDEAVAAVLRGDAPAPPARATARATTRKTTRRPA